jgi:hypothetical protein
MCDVVAQCDWACVVAALDSTIGIPFSSYEALEHRWVVEAVVCSVEPLGTVPDWLSALLVSDR